MFGLRCVGVGLAVSFVVLVVGGCGARGPEIAYVEGRITMDGKPLADATVVFVPENGRPSGATTDGDGNYVLNFAQGRKGALPGTSTVRIMTMRDAGQDEDGQTIPGRKETIPAQYNVESTLTFDVEPKKRNVANFELQSTGVGSPRSS
jgi:hypothetical protein